MTQYRKVRGCLILMSQLLVVRNELTYSNRQLAAVVTAKQKSQVNKRARALKAEHLKSARD